VCPIESSQSLKSLIAPLLVVSSSLFSGKSSLPTRGVRIFDSANSNFEKVEKFDSNSNWRIVIRFARIAVVQNSFMNNSKARSNIRELFPKIRCKITGYV
jgi:uncharacterized membrane protein